MLCSFILISFDSYSQDEISFLNGSINNCNSQLNFIQINDSTATYTNVYGVYQAIMWDEEHKVYYGASDPRKDGQAAGY